MPQDMEPLYLPGQKEPLYVPKGLKPDQLQKYVSQMAGFSQPKAKPLESPYKAQPKGSGDLRLDPDKPGVMGALAGGRPVTAKDAVTTGKGMASGAGSVAAGLLFPPAGVGMAVVTSMLGAVVGEGAAILAEKAVGDPDAPKSLLEAGKRMGREGLVMGALEIPSAGLATAARAGGKGAVDVAIGAAERTGAGKAYRAAQNEARVLGLKAQIDMNNTAAEGILDGIRAEGSLELKAKNAQVVNRAYESVVKKQREAMATAVHEVALEGGTVDLTGPAADFLKDLGAVTPKPGAPVVGGGIHPDIQKYVDLAREGVKIPEPIAPVMKTETIKGDVATGASDRTVTREVSKGRQDPASGTKVPLASITWAIGDMKQILETSGKAMKDTERAAFTRYVNRLETIAHNEFDNMGASGEELFKLYQKTYAATSEVLEGAALKAAKGGDVDSLVRMVGSNPRSARLVKEVSESIPTPPRGVAGKPRGGPAFLEDVQDRFMQGLLKDSKGKVDLSGFGRKIDEYGESAAILMQGKMPMVNRLKSMAETNTMYLELAAKDSKIPPPESLMAMAWEAATSRTAGAGMGAGLGYLAGHGPLGATLGAGVGAGASSAVPIAILQKIADNPAAYAKWKSGMTKLGSSTGDAIEGLSAAIRIAAPEMLDPVRRTVGAEPRPLPR